MGPEALNFFTLRGMKASNMSYIDAKQPDVNSVTISPPSLIKSATTISKPFAPSVRHSNMP